MSQKRHFMDLVIMAAIFAFLLCYFEPRCLVSKTVTTGGDTASHYYTAKYLKDYLLPHHKISGWCQGNLAGFPILQYYFPLPFLLMATLSWLLPLEIAFKLVTVLGTFLLPLCTYVFFRSIKQRFPIPIIGAVFSLPFLFMEGNSMWGGNIPSTLAGEFSYSLGFSLSILWLGLFYRVISDQKGILLCSFLLATVGLCHGYILVFVTAASVFFLISKDRFSQNLQKVIKIHLLAFSLMAFWLLPLIAFLPYTTRFNIYWIFSDWRQVLREVFPVIICPFVGISLAATLWALFGRLRSPKKASIEPFAYVSFLAFCGLVLYGLGYRLGVVNVRFLPFFQFFLTIGSVLAFTLISFSKRSAVLTASIALLLSLLWVDRQETFIGKWIRSNYEGFEKKELWQPFSEVNRFLKGTAQDPRVIYEHSMLHKRAGTVRAFECLPLFSGRSTLEGVYIQAGPSAPFIFYIQSETSQKASTPIPDYNYSRFRLKRAIEHLKLFNVKDFIAVTAETKEALDTSPEFQHSGTFGPYDIYELKTNNNRYVQPVRYKPVLTAKKDWRKVSYLWFRRGNLSVPLVFDDKVKERDRSRFLVKEHPDIIRLPKEPLETSVPLRETIEGEKILIEGAQVGKPLLIKISYHPNWKVKGADKIYLVSPAFMLVYPRLSRVSLYYSRTWPDYLGLTLTLMGVLLLLIHHFWDLSGILLKPFSSWFDRYGTRIGLFFMAALAIGITYYLFRFSAGPPILTYHRGLEHLEKKEYSKAKKDFEEVIARHPQTLVADQAAYHYAMCFFREKNWEKALKGLRWLITNYPETRRAAEACYHIGLCYLKLGNEGKAREAFKRTIRKFPRETWAVLSANRLKEMVFQ